MEKVIPIKIRLEAKDASDKAAKLQLDLSMLAKQIKAAKKAGDEEILSELIKAQSQYREELKQTNRALRLNGEEQAAIKKKLPIDSIRQLRIDYRKLKAEIIDLSTADPKFEELSKEALQLSKTLRKLEAENLGSFNRGVGNYQNSIEAALQATSGLFTSNSTDIISLVSDLSLIGGAAGGILSSVIETGVAAKDAVFELIEEIENLKLEVSNTLQSNTSETIVWTSELKAISELLEVDFGDSLRAANSLSVEFGEEFGSSLDLVEKTLQRVANRGQALDEIDEFASKAKQAGIEVKEFTDILITSQQLSSFNDSNIDGIIEGTLRIREAADSTMKSFENAFGEEFTTKLFNNVKNGSITAFEGLKQVGKALQDDTIDAQQFQEVVSSISDSAETSIASILTTLEAVGSETSRATDRTSKYIERLEKLSAVSKQVSLNQTLLATQLSSVKNNFDLQSKIIENSFLTSLNKGIVLVRALSKSLGRLAKGDLKGSLDFDSIQKEIAAASREAAEFNKNIKGGGDGDQPDLDPTPIKNQLEMLGELRSSLAETIKLGLLNKDDVTAEVAKYNAISKEIAGVEDRFKELTKAGIEADENSLQALRERLSEINKDIQASDDETLLTELTMQAIEAEAAIEEAQSRINAIRRSVEGGVTPVQLLPSTDIAPVESDGTNDVSEAVARIDEVAKQKIVSLQELALQEKITNEELAQQRVDVQRAADIQALQFRLDNEKLTAEKTLELRTELNDKLLAQELSNIDEIQEKRSKTKQIISRVADFAIDINNKIADVELGKIERNFESRRSALDDEYDRRIEQAQGNAALVEELERQRDERTRELAKQQAKEEQQVSLKRAIVNGALGFVKALTSALPPFNFINAAAVAAATAFQIAEIKAQKFQHGGIIEGASHAQGGVMARNNSTGEIVELEGGEAVINRKSTAMFKDELSAINTAGGGKKFNQGGITDSFSVLRATNPSFALLNPPPFTPRTPPDRVIVNPNDFISPNSGITDEQMQMFARVVASEVRMEIEQATKQIPQATKEAVENGMIEAKTNIRRIERQRASGKK